MSQVDGENLMFDKPIIDNIVQVRHQKHAEILSRIAGDREGREEKEKSAQKAAS